MCPASFLTRTRRNDIFGVSQFLTQQASDHGFCHYAGADERDGFV
jgi:hypothetical protein